MAFTEEQQRQILARIRERISVPGGGFRTCPICGHANWSLQTYGLVYLVMQSGAGVLELGGPSLPSIALICTTCGDTQLLNAFVLGVGEILGLTPTSSQPEPVPPPPIGPPIAPPPTTGEVAP